MATTAASGQLTHPSETPWKWHPKSIDQAHDGSVFRMERPGQAYAIAIQPRYVSNAQWAADAALIVKAVNAHQTLVNALKKISDIEDSYFGSDWAEIEEARNIADQALASIGEKT